MLVFQMIQDWHGSLDGSVGAADAADPDAKARFQLGAWPYLDPLTPEFREDGQRDWYRDNNDDVVRIEFFRALQGASIKLINDGLQYILLMEGSMPDDAADSVWIHGTDRENNNNILSLIK